MVDMAAFGDESFNAKVWVNAACRAMHPDEDAERYLSDLEMKLQLASEGIANALEEQSASALFRVPRAMRDAARLHDDAVALRSNVSGMLLKLKQAEGKCEESVNALSRFHVCKQRMEAAHKTLKDAAGLAELCASVENVFASGDLPQAAETLANMRRCLVVVGEVPEFASVKRDLEALENRLDGMVQTRLTDALSQRKVEAVQGFRDILKTIDRYSSLEQQYTKVRMKPLRRLWDEFDGTKTLTVNGNLNGTTAATSFPEWLPRFYDQILLALEQELKWCTAAFPEDYQALISRLLVETMTSVSANFVSRVEAAEPSAVGRPGPSFNLLLTLHNATTAFAKNIERLLISISPSEMPRVLKAIYAPFEGFKQRYGELERGQLLANVATIDLRGAVQRAVGSRGVELSETVQRIEASIPAVTGFLEAAVERCINFTGGSEFEALLKVLDETIFQYAASLHEVLKSLRPVCGVSHVQLSSDASTKKLASDQNKTTVDTIPEEEEWSIVQGALQLVTVANSLSSRLSVFEASLRGTICRVGDQLLASDNQHDIATLRLEESRDKARRLTSLLEQATDPRFRGLAHASHRVSSFVEAVNELVYEVLISKVRTRLSEVAQLPVWSSSEEQSAFALPSFSAYPLSYVTSIGEYLLTLPEQLEPLTTSSAASDSADNADEGQYFATEWMFKVAEGATALYIEQIRGIPSLSERGAQQLSADIEYLCNVLSALSMNIPPVLLTFQTCVSASQDKLREILKLGAPDLDNATVRLICKMRQIALD